ncbi:beta-N-acetylhexosaminidase [Algoriphagus machipongonensis]|uniref:beta-N-acetylhexosaminidase n=1 Tax=Algoriphagus machipongonensis TaxID=388413 RepID=A3HSG0_9BACT|nr:beta-N-acetylhexosaminidase [Algoriphagus machipongonensis]EAZ82778.1 beta-N-acetylhexosaminidase [Algoriphagus machipongonensis]
MRKPVLGLVTLISAVLFSCQKPLSELESAAIIPLPSSIVAGHGSFELNSGSAIQIIGNSEGLQGLGEVLASRLKPATGFDLPVNADGGDIQLELLGGEESEAYTLVVEEDLIKITANSEAGLFYGIQTLVQLFPVAIENNSITEASWTVPAGKIVDQPEYGYRGSMLDVARHFFTVDDVKYYIDEMAKLKLNSLHLHLTDDQGWRIEIKSWPNLTTIGGKSEVGGGDGGFYTQEDYKEIIAYAAKNYITVIPEIDMPGHTNAALASYGELNPGVNLPDGDFSTMNEGEIDFDILDGDPKAAEIYTGIEVGFSTLATNKEITYQFVEDVIREISEMTPGPYFHIGGDESHVTEKDDYIEFVERVQKITAKYGKTSIGWDEIATTELLKGNVAQFWALAENAKLAIEQGNQVLMSPAKKAYLDMQYDSTSRLGLHWAAYIELDSAYIWDPENYDPGIKKQDIFGIEAPLWTETIETREDLNYMVFPRIAAIAEIAWTPSEKREWSDFQKRIAVQGKRWDINGIGLYKSPKVEW